MEPAGPEHGICKGVGRARDVSGTPLEAIRQGGVYSMIAERRFITVIGLLLALPLVALSTFAAQYQGGGAEVQGAKECRPMRGSSA